MAGKDFTDHYGIPTDVARRYAVEVRRGLLLIDLTQDAPEVTGVRARSRGERAG